jgi:hypothetical protein
VWADVSERCNDAYVQDVSTQDPRRVLMPGVTSLLRLRKIWPALRAIPVRDEHDAAARQNWDDAVAIVELLETRFGHARLMMWAIALRV